MSPIPPDSMPKHVFLWTALLFCQKEKLIFHLCKLQEEGGTGRLLNSAQEKYSPCSYLPGSGSDPSPANVGGPGLKLWSDPGIRWGFANLPSPGQLEKMIHLLSRKEGQEAHHS